MPASLTLTPTALRDIHRRVGSAIFFESSGGQVNRMAHLPELRFAIGGPAVDTASVDNAAYKIEDRSFYIRKVGTDGYQISYRPTLKKVVSERRSSLDYQNDIYPAMTKLVKDMFDRGRNIARRLLPADANAVDDSPKLTLVVMDPATKWNTQIRAPRSPTGRGSHAAHWRASIRARWSGASNSPVVACARKCKT